jgi:hypothetical protein
MNRGAASRMFIRYARNSRRHSKGTEIADCSVWV